MLSHSYCKLYHYFSLSTAFVQNIKVRKSFLHRLYFLLDYSSSYVSQLFKELEGLSNFRIKSIATPLHLSRILLSAMFSHFHTDHPLRGRHKRRPHNTARKNFDEVNIERKCFRSFLIFCMKEIRRLVFIIQIIHFFTLLCTCQQRSKNFSPCALVLSSVSKTVYKFRGFYNAVVTDLSSKPPS